MKSWVFIVKSTTTGPSIRLGAMQATSRDVMKVAGTLVVLKRHFRYSKFADLSEYPPPSRTTRVPPWTGPCWGTRRFIFGGSWYSNVSPWSLHCDSLEDISTGLTPDVPGGLMHCSHTNDVTRAKVGDGPNRHIVIACCCTLLHRIVTCVPPCDGPTTGKS